MRYGVIVNPTSGKNTGAQIGLDAVGRLRAAGAQIVDLSALDAAGALARGRAAIAKGEIDTLVVAGAGSPTVPQMRTRSGPSCVS